MRKDINTMVCPVGLAGGLDNPLRRLFQNPRKILQPYIRPGMTVLDLGCGPGFFSIEIAKLLAGSGKLIAADLQQGMLDRVLKKIRGTEMDRIIQTHRCEAGRIGLTEKVDFALAFYVVHEMPDHDALFRELKSIIRPEGRLFIIEPRFHVTQKAFGMMENRLADAGFTVVDRPRLAISRAILATARK